MVQWIDGKLLSIIRSMYSEAKSRVINNLELFRCSSVLMFGYCKGK